MFSSIFRYEIKYWLRQPSTYVYAAILFGLAFITMTGMASEPPNRFNNRLVNSPIFMFKMTRKFMMLAFLFLPAIIGLSVFRDFNSKTFTLLFSYPIKKWEYLLAKFLSSFIVLCFITSMLGLGYLLGSNMPWVEVNLVGNFGGRSYFDLFVILLLPNLFVISAVVFGVTVMSRNIYAGFISVILFLLLSNLTGALFSGEGLAFWDALFNPLGSKAISFHAKNWTVAEQNELAIPLKGILFYNRLFWIAIGLVVLGITHRFFQLEQHPLSLGRKQQSTSKKQKLQLGSIIKINLPSIQYDFSLFQHFKTVWELSKHHFSFIITSKSFISLVIGGFTLVIIVLLNVSPRWDTVTFPMTWQMLELPSVFYAGVINFITFLYAGLLVHRERMSQMNQLVDVNPIPNWVFLSSKFLALIKMQMVLLAMIMIGGIISQAYKGFYEFEIGQYLFNLYGLNLIHFVIWAMLALFIQTVIDHPYLGFFFLLLAPFGFIGLAEFAPNFLGIHFLEQLMFRYNQAPGDVFGLRYSDMDGYSGMLSFYYLYKCYWFLAGTLLLLGALLWVNRGLVGSFKERFIIAKQRFKGQLALSFMIVLFAFSSLGFAIYYEGNFENTYFSRVEKRAALKAAEKKYKRFKHFVQPKIVDVKINMDIFPEQRQFKANGQYIVVNQSQQAIDTLIVNYISGLHITYEIDQPVQAIHKDPIANLGHFDIIILKEKMQPGDSLVMTFENYNDPQTVFRTNSFVKQHGTYLQNDIFPLLGNYLDHIRDSNSLGKTNHRPHPSDTTVHHHSFMARDADRISFEAIVSTSNDQIAIAPGDVIKEWETDGRRFSHYKMDRKIALSYLFTSGEYAISKDKWKEVDLEIYYHKDHPYNINRMMDGIKAGLSYCSENFSPYQFNQVRMVEFSQTGRATAHGFPNTIPAGEGAGFIADVDDSKEGGTDYAFGTAVHEVAHQWWGHQVIPADVLGAKMVVESLAEYVNVKVKEHEKGVDKMRHYLKHSLTSYLQLRNQTSQFESPLMYTYPNENYIHYPKGAMVFYMMSDYLGENKLNNAIKNYVERVAFQEGEYTTSIELVDFIRAATPDSLQYLIKDWFETVTLYENQLVDWTATPLDNGQFKIEIECLVRKYRSVQDGQMSYSDNGLDSLSYQMEDSKPTLYSLPLSDYVEIGIFGKSKKELHLDKYHFDQIHNKMTIVLDEEPTEVGIDPYIKLIDREWKDNRNLK